MNLRSIGLALGIAALSITASSVSARALDFSFSFPLSLEAPNGSTTTTSVSSTISGIIEGVQDNATSGATDIIITNDPGLNISSSTPLYYKSGTLTVTNGEITDVSNADFKNGSDEVVLNLEVLAPPPITYYNEITDGTTTAYSSQAASFITTSGNTVSSSFSFQQIPWEFNPGEMVGLGVPLIMGLRVLRKKLVLR